MVYLAKSPHLVCPVKKIFHFFFREVLISCALHPDIKSEEGRRDFPKEKRMKKFFIVFALIFVSVFCLAATSDPFATRKFVGNDIEISFREQDSEARPQVSFKNDSFSGNYYYNFDDSYIVLFDENHAAKEVFGYTFINNGNDLRLFDDRGRFFDLQSDNGKTKSDSFWEAVDVVAQNFLIYGGSGTAIGAVAGGPIGAAIGIGVGGFFGVGKALTHDIFGWI